MNRVKHPNASLGKKVVTIIGGGFAGLSAAKHLADKQNDAADRYHPLFFHPPRFKPSKNTIMILRAKI